MTTTQVVETSVTVNDNSAIQDYVHPDDQTDAFEMTCGFKPMVRFGDGHNMSGRLLYERQVSCDEYAVSFQENNCRADSSVERALVYSAEGRDFKLRADHQPMSGNNW